VGASKTKTNGASCAVMPWPQTLLDGAAATAIIGTVSVVVAIRLAKRQVAKDQERDVRQRNAERALALELTAVQAAQALAAELSECLDAVSRYNMMLQNGSWKPSVPDATPLTEAFTRYTRCVRAQASSLGEIGLRDSLRRSLAITDTMAMRFHLLRLTYSESFQQDMSAYGPSWSPGDQTPQARENLVGLLVHAVAYLHEVLVAVVRYQQGDTPPAITEPSGFLDTSPQQDPFRAGGAWGTLSPTWGPTDEAS
jgi:hypothetical protein